MTPATMVRPEPVPSGAAYRRGTASRVLRGSAIALVAASAVTLLARQTCWQPGPLVVAVAATPYLVLAGVAAGALAAATRAWLVLALAVAVTVTAGATQAPLFTRDAAPAPGPVVAAPVLRVASANLRFGQADLQQLLRLVRDERVDVLAFQEMTPEAAGALSRSGLEVLLPHRYAVPMRGPHGGGLWSRWPLTDQRRIGGLAANVVATADVPGWGPVTFASVHPAAPNPLATAHWRAEQLEVADDLSALPGTVVAAGDYNATVDHVGLRRLAAAGFGNAAAQSGAGLVRTWPHERLLPLPLFGIDHVLSRGPVTATSVRAYQIAGTDHAALVVELVRT